MKGLSGKVKERLQSQFDIGCKLADTRLNLSVIQRIGDDRMYGEGLIEYAKLLGEWEALLTC